MDKIRVKSSGNLGDIIYSLSVIRMYCKTHDVQCEYYFHLNQPSTYKDEKQHPLGNVMLNQTMFDMAKPLLECQDYISKVDVYDGQELDFDLDLFRTECKNLSAGDIKLWYSIPYPELTAITNLKCLHVEPINNDWIIWNRSTRYNNPLIDYTSLEKLGKTIKFVGVESEYKIIKTYMPEVEHLQVKDFKELAQYIAGSYLFVGNQSMAFSIAEQLKVRRILEQYIYAPNVIPQGGEHYQFHTQKQLESILTLIK